MPVAEQAAIHRHIDVTALLTALLTALADSLQAKLGSLVRVLRIDEDDHPDVVQSFAITLMPAFVLVRQGVELWRQQGLADEMMVVERIRRLLKV